MISPHIYDDRCFFFVKIMGNNQKVLLKITQAELKLAQKRLPHRAWHAAAPVFTLGTTWFLGEPYALAILPFGAVATLAVSIDIVDSYEKVDRLELKCAQLEAEIAAEKD